MTQCSGAASTQALQPMHLCRRKLICIWLNFVQFIGWADFLTYRHGEVNAQPVDGLHRLLLQVQEVTLVRR